MNRFFVVDFTIYAALGIVLLQGNLQTAVAEETASSANAATQRDADSLSFQRSPKAACDR